MICDLRPVVDFCFQSRQFFRPNFSAINFDKRLQESTSELAISQLPVEASVTSQPDLQVQLRFRGETILNRFLSSHPIWFDDH